LYSHYNKPPPFLAARPLQLNWDTGEWCDRVVVVVVAVMGAENGCVCVEAAGGGGWRPAGDGVTIGGCSYRQSSFVSDLVTSSPDSPVDVPGPTGCRRQHTSVGAGLGWAGWVV